MWHNLAHFAAAVNDLDDLVAWMRANGVLECTHEGTTVRLASVDPPSPPAIHDGDEAESVPRPLPEGGCRRCGEPRGGIYADRGLCRRCGYLEQLGAARN